MIQIIITKHDHNKHSFSVQKNGRKFIVPEGLINLNKPDVLSLGWMMKIIIKEFSDMFDDTYEELKEKK